MRQCAVSYVKTIEHCSLVYGVWSHIVTTEIIIGTFRKNAYILIPVICNSNAWYHYNKVKFTCKHNNYFDCLYL